MMRLGTRPIELQLRTYSGDLFILHEIFLSECYALPPGLDGQVKVVVDLGANIGLTTLYYAHRYPGARFVCVEPDPGNARLLRHNVAALGDRVLVVEGAVSDVAGTAGFDATGWSWGRQFHSGDRAATTVRCFTVPEILELARMARVDLMKVDIEDAVEQVFGSRNGWLSRVDTIVAELTVHYPFPRFEEDVRPFGLRAFPVGSPIGNAMVLATRFPARLA
jgi:FkbM family methyltransferase